MNIRKIEEDDINFILSTWLKSYYDNLKGCERRGLPCPDSDIFYSKHQAKIKDVLKKALNHDGSNAAFVCTAPDDLTQIMGYIVFDAECIHYCFVKNVYRKLGVGRKLMEKSKAAKYFSHHTKHARFLNHGLRFDPYRF